MLKDEHGIEWSVSTMEWYQQALIVNGEYEEEYEDWECEED